MSRLLLYVPRLVVLTAWHTGCYPVRIMKTAFLHIRVEDELKREFDAAMPKLVRDLGLGGATTSNVIAMMMRALVDTLATGQRPVVPFECKTRGAEDQSARIAADSKPTWGPSPAGGSSPAAGPGPRAPRFPAAKGKPKAG